MGLTMIYGYSYERKDLHISEHRATEADVGGRV